MVKTRAVFFWMAGVITPGLTTLLMRALYTLGQSEVNPYALPGWSQLTERLALGQVDAPKFCTSICEQIGLPIDPLELDNNIRVQLHPLPQVLETIDLLPETCERWLVIDLPPSWLNASLERLELVFQADHWVRLAEAGLIQLMPDALYTMTRQAQVHPAEGLLIDASTRRTVQALRHGFQAAAFIDARRLERELTMRYLIDRPHPVHKPN